MPNGFLLLFFFICHVVVVAGAGWGGVASTKLPRIMLRSFYPLFANQKNYVFIAKRERQTEYRSTMNASQLVCVWFVGIVGNSASKPG